MLQLAFLRWFYNMRLVFCVNPLKIEVPVAVSCLFSVNGCCIDGNCWMLASKSKSSDGITLNWANACFTAACTNA